MVRPKKSAGRVADSPSVPDLVVRDARWSIENGSQADLENDVSLVAALIGAPHAGEVITPAPSILAACTRANDVGGLLVASAVERFGPPAFRAKAAAVADRLAAVFPDDAERLRSIGTVTPVRAMALTEPHHNGHLLVLESERPDGSRVTVQATIETALRGAAVEFAHDVDTDMVFGAAEEEPSLTVDELDPAEARAWLEHALEMRSNEFVVNPEDDDDMSSEEVLTIVRHFFLQCPEGGSLPARAALPDDAEIARMVEDFRASPAAAALDDATQAGMDVHLDRIVDFGRGVSGRPLWWSPIAVQLFQQYAEYAFPDEIEAMRPVVIAWAIWAGDTVGKDEPTITETLLAIEHLLRPADEHPGLRLP